MRIRWRLRRVAADREVWTSEELRRRLAARAGLSLSSAAVAALMRVQPRQVKLQTLEALCITLDCTPNDLLALEDTQAADTRAGDSHNSGQETDTSAST